MALLNFTASELLSPRLGAGTIAREFSHTGRVIGEIEVAQLIGIAKKITGLRDERGAFRAIELRQSARFA